MARIHSATGQQKYHGGLRALHWLMAVVIMGMLASGWFMEDLPEAYRRTVYGVHKSLGVTILGLIWVRLCVRWMTVLPALPPAIAPMQKMAALTVQRLFYGMMVAMPLSGYIMSNSKGYPVQWFGIPLPSIMGKDDVINGWASEAHELLAIGFITLLVAHVGGVVVHHLRDRVPLLQRMW